MAGFAAQYCGQDEAAGQLAARIHSAALKAGDFARAARMAFWIGMAFLQRGDVTQGGGWLGRAARLLEEHELDTVELGVPGDPGRHPPGRSRPSGRARGIRARRGATPSDSATPISRAWRGWAGAVR